jgi:hypothetical protein
MQHLGFHVTWLQWIYSCIASPSFSILLNGSSFGLFFPSRRLRQGDHLSPFLFILGSELLSRLLLKEERLGKIKGMKIARNSPAINTYCLLMTYCCLVRLLSLKLRVLKFVLINTVLGQASP